MFSPKVVAVLVFFSLQVLVFAEDNLLPDESSCGQYHRESLVKDAKINEYPWNVLLKYQIEDDKQFLCTGVLINKKYVLTSAHCVPPEETKAKLLSVRLGEHNLQTDPDCEDSLKDSDNSKHCAPSPLDIPVEKIIVHEDYDPDDPYYDIALLRLQSKVTFNSYISPVCLLSEDHDRNYTGSQVVATGWRMCNSNPAEKKKIAGVVKDESYCEDFFKINLDQNLLCIVEERKGDFQFEDSGGCFFYRDPVSLSYYAIGLNIFEVCGFEKYPRVYGRLDQYFEWIVANLRP